MSLLEPQIAGKSALVSAAAQGIGRGVCLALAELGANVVCLDLPTQRVGGEETVALIKKAGGDGVFVACDVTDRAQVDAAVKAACEAFGAGGLDICVAAVGGGPRVPFLEETPEMYHKTLALTQHSTWHQTQSAARVMQAQGRGGRIVIVGSIMADMASPHAATYSMAKCATRQLARTIAGELAPHGISVNVVQPGYIDTPGERRNASDEEIKSSALCIPQKRMGQPRDIGNCVAFLCSAAASYITGSVLDCDGGFKIALALPGHTQNEGEETAKPAAAADES